MKFTVKILIACIIGITIFIGYRYIYYIFPNYITTSLFTETHENLNIKIKKINDKVDYINKRLDTIQHNQNIIILHMDSLKRGQYIIYEEVKKDNTSFWKSLKF